MALQGTIETFALPDVMRLLASTKKTGCLRVDGSRGTGRVWVDGGQIVGGEASEAPHANGAVEVFFELLRFKDGDFVFDADVQADSPEAAADVEPVLDEAEKMLEEWKSIESVVPSLDAWVSLVEDLGSDEVSISKDRWKMLVTIAGGTTVGRLGDAFEMGELPVSRAVKELVEAGLATVGDAPSGMAASSAPPAATPQPAPTSAPDLGSTETSEAYEPFDRDALVVEHDDVTAPETAPAPPPAPAPTAAAAGSGFDADPLDAAEIARQLANLSPKAAKAVAAAAKATTQEEREAALAEVDDEDDPINRDLLIKFLGSVNG